MKIGNINFSTFKTVQDLARYITIAIGEIVNAINGQISFQDNISGNFVTFTFTGASQTVGQQHNLGRVPTGYIVSQRSTGVEVFDGTTGNTSDTLYLQSTGAGSITVFVF